MAGHGSGFWGLGLGLRGLESGFRVIGSWVLEPWIWTLVFRILNPLVWGLVSGWQVWIGHPGLWGLGLQSKVWSWVWGFQDLSFGQWILRPSLGSELGIPGSRFGAWV